MATILNNPLCATNTGNVGTPSCAISIDHLNGLFITEDSFEISNANLATWDLALAALKTACLAPLGQRIYPLFDLIGMTDNTPAPEAKTSGYGVMTSYVEKPHSFEIEMRDLGIKYYEELRKFRNRKDLRFFWIDSAFIGGEKTSTGIRGFKGTFKPKQVKVGNVADITKYMVQLDLVDPTILTDKMSSITIPEDVVLSSECSGILNVNLEVISAPSATGATITATTEISKTNLYDEYSGVTLLGDKANWVANLSTTGAVVTILTCTAVPGTKAFALTWASAAAPVNVKLAAPSVLAAAGIGGNGTSGFESDTVSCPIA